MTSFDTAVLVLCLALAGRGLWTGMVSQIAAIAGLVLGFIAAGRFHVQFSEHVLPFVSVPQIAFFITYALLFLGVYLLVVLAGVALRKVMKITMLSGFDRAAGGLFGLGKGVFIASLVFIVLAGTFSSSGSFLRRSYSYPWLKKSSGFILGFVKDKDLRSRFLPKEPAITSLFSRLDGNLSHRPEETSGLTRDQKLALEELRYNLARDFAENPKR